MGEPVIAGLSLTTFPKFSVGCRTAVSLVSLVVDAELDWGKVKRTMGGGMLAFAARPTSDAKAFTSESVRIVSGLPSELEYVNVQAQVTA